MGNGPSSSAYTDYASLRCQDALALTMLQGDSHYKLGPDSNLQTFEKQKAKWCRCSFGPRTSFPKMLSFEAKLEQDNRAKKEWTTEVMLYPQPTGHVLRTVYFVLCVPSRMGDTVCL